jgi:hypothetical protein
VVCDGSGTVVLAVVCMGVLAVGEGVVVGGGARVGAGTGAGVGAGVSARVVTGVGTGMGTGTGVGDAAVMGSVVNPGSSVTKGNATL